jgi:hypothetical protein
MTVDGTSQQSFLVIQVKEQFKVPHEKPVKGLTGQRTLSGFFTLNPRSVKSMQSRAT